MSFIQILWTVSEKSVCEYSFMYNNSQKNHLGPSKFTIISLSLSQNSMSAILGSKLLSITPRDSFLALPAW